MDINWLAVIVAGVVYFMIGGLWYSVLFTKLFLKYRNATPEELSGPPYEYIATVVIDLISALVLAVVLKALGITDLGTGVLISVLIGFGIGSTSTLTFAIYSGPHKALWLIYTGYQLVAFAVMGAILTLWR